MKQEIDTSYLEPKDLLLSSLDRRCLNCTNIYGTKFNPYPIKVERNLWNRVAILHQTIIEAVEKIVTNYFRDRDIQSKLILCDRSEEILKLAQDIPYSIGVLRPDFLFDRGRTIKVCEINARFAVNGLVMSNFLADYFSRGSPGLGEEVVKTIIGNFDSKKPLRIIKGIEKGYDIHFIYEELKKHRYDRDIEFIKPEELNLKGDKLYAKDLVCDRFILELHQQEILALPLPILRHLMERTKYINDIRTILIAHNKRLLSILGDRKIMSRYLNEEQLDLLGKHVIYTANIDRHIKQDILDNADRWVIKKCLSGKAEGMYVAGELNKKDLNSILDKSADIYVAQHYIKQKYFAIANLIDNKLQTTDKHLVGLSMSFNRQFLGIGFFRGGRGDIINVSTKDGEIIPVC